MAVMIQINRSNLVGESLSIQCNTKVERTLSGIMPLINSLSVAPISLCTIIDAGVQGILVPQTGIIRFPVLSTPLLNELKNSNIVIIHNY